MARSNGWIGRSRSSPARPLPRAAPRALAALALGLFAGASQVRAEGAPAAPSPPKITSPAPKKPPPETPTPKESLPSVLRERARAAMEANELAESRAALLALQVLDPTVSAACNLGLVARRLSLWVEAAENLSRCVRAYAAVPAAGRALTRYDEMRAELAMARAMVAAVRVETPAGARVTIDGKVLGPLTPQRELFLSPGAHVLEVANERREVDLLAGSTRLLDFTAPQPPPKPKGVDPIAFLNGAGIGAGAGAGAGLLGLSFIYRGVAEDTLRQIEQTSGGSACREPWRSPGSCGALTRYSTAASILLGASIGSFVLSGALIAGAALSKSAKQPPARVVVGLGGVRVEAAW